jgi:phosphate transport system substrate-binding protein
MRYLYFLTILWGACTDAGHTIKIKGSDTEVNLSVRLAEAFHQQDKQTFVSISGGGSGLGIASLLNGTADVANSSRSINEEELLLFKKQNIRLDSFIFAQDAVAFIVSDKTNLNEIDIKSLAKILSGEISNWNQIINQNEVINIYGRQSNSGTYEYVKKILNIKFSPQAKQMNGNAQIIEAIKADPSGIGYVGAGYVMGENRKGIKVLSIYENDRNQSISPFDTEKISTGNYIFQRPLFQYYKAADFEKVKPFLAFEQSQKGADIIQQSGYYPTLPQQTK